jgi:hypothetical protein
VHPSRWISVLLAAVLLLQPLACCKRIDAVSAGETCASKEGDVLYVTLKDGTQYELVNWQIGQEWVEGERKMVHVTIADDGTATEEEYLEPARYTLSEVADLDVEKVDCRSLWVVGAIAGGVVAGLAAMAALAGDDSGDSGSSGGGIGNK